MVGDPNLLINVGHGFCHLIFLWGAFFFFDGFSVGGGQVVLTSCRSPHAEIAQILDDDFFGRLRVFRRFLRKKGPAGGA
jgi:hypothetical protein